MAARFLHQNNIPVVVFLVGSKEKFKGEALAQLQKVEEIQIPIKLMSDFETLNKEFKLHPPQKLIVIDAILGTGFHGEPRPPALLAIKAINDLKKNHPGKVTVLAADIPSGLNGDEGFTETEAVRADTTLTFAAPKQGLTVNSAQAYIGNLEVVDIGIPTELLQSVTNNKSS